MLRDGTGPNNTTPKVIHNLRGDSGHYWSDDNIEVLSPTTGLIGTCNTSENYNNCSYVVKLTYAGRTVVLPGDAEGPAWTSMLEELGEDALKCDVLKAAHHGRESGYDEDAVSAMSPDIVICSVGKKPSTDASDEYASHGADVLSTRFHGTITVSVDSSGRVTVKNRKGEEIASLSRLYLLRSNAKASSESSKRDA